MVRSRDDLTIVEWWPAAYHNFFSRMTVHTHTAYRYTALPVYGVITPRPLSNQPNRPHRLFSDAIIAYATAIAVMITSVVLKAGMFN